MAEHRKSAAAETAVVPLTAPVRFICKTKTNNSIIVPIILPHPGPIGVTLCRGAKAGTVIKNVSPHSQAGLAGLREGDVPVLSTPRGKKIAIPHDTFLRACTSAARPVVFEVLRSVSPVATGLIKPSSAIASAPAKKETATKSCTLVTNKVPGDNELDNKVTKLVESRKLPTSSTNENVPNGASTAHIPLSNANAVGATMAPLFPPPVPVPSGDQLATLLAMSKKQLLEELSTRGIKVTKAATKDVMLGKLGVPSTQWREWRAMNMKQLKEELRKRGEPLKGKKEDLLERLGVPKGFGESSYEKFNREFAESERAWKKRKKEVDKKTESLAALVLSFAKDYKKKQSANRLSPEDDPTHEMYEEPCCDAPSFPNGEEPAGSITYPNGSLSEVWRCAACGQIPKHPNAPPIDEFSSYDEYDSDEHDREDGDCIIQ